MFPLLKDQKAQVISQAIRQSWQRAVAKSNPSLQMAILRVYWTRLVGVGIIYFFKDGLTQ